MGFPKIEEVVSCRSALIPGETKPSNTVKHETVIQRVGLFPGQRRDCLSTFEADARPMRRYGLLERSPLWVVAVNGGGSVVVVSVVEWDSLEATRTKDEKEGQERSQKVESER